MDEVLVAWLVKHCAWIQRKSTTQHDGHSAHYRVTGAEYQGEVVPFAEIVMAKMPNNSKTNPSKLAPRWVRAVWLGAV